MAKIQSHHPDKKNHPDWTLPLKAYHHRLVMMLERESDTIENLMYLRNLNIATNHIEEKRRRKLDLNDIDKGKNK